MAFSRAAGGASEYGAYCFGEFMKRGVHVNSNVKMTTFRSPLAVAGELHARAELALLLRAARGGGATAGEQRGLRAVDPLQYEHLALAVVLLALKVLQVLKEGGTLATREQDL